MGIDDERLKRHPAALLNYAVWRAMASPDTRPPKAQRKGFELWRALAPADVAELEAYGQAGCALIDDHAHTAAWARPHRQSLEVDGKAAIRKALPALDDWTLDCVWGVSFQRWMM